MRFLRNTRRSPAIDNSTRAPIRKQLRLARKGNLHAYRLLVEPYFNLVTEYLHLCNWSRHEVLHQADAVFRATWKRLPYLKRLSDWERVLAVTLTTMADSPASVSAFGQSERINYLGPTEKFALVAFDLENWNPYWLGLALRQSPEDVAETLFKARCQLLHFDPNQGNRTVQRLLREVSRDIDGQMGPRRRVQIQQRLSRNPTARDFKSRWLDVRCQLIELRQQIRFQPEERDAFLGALDNLSAEKMMRPSLRTRARNVVSFAGAPAPNILPVRQHPIQNAG